MAPAAAAAAVLLLFAIFAAASPPPPSAFSISSSRPPSSPHAYATILYVGTPRDYEYYVAARVLLRSLYSRFHVHADVLLIASNNTPPSWLHSFVEDGIRVIQVQNVFNPYAQRPGFNPRFMFTLNKLLAWSLVEYERIVMLDADNLVQQNPDELFQCGEFCATFIDPCIFHTGLFVLQPSSTVFSDMLERVNRMSENRDGADQGFLAAYFPDLLDKPMFRPPSDGSKLSGQYRLPFGYQMDASYYYLRLKWRVPCGPNSIITYPGVPLLKPWYWWSWPVLPLGLAWHDMRASTIGYKEETSIIIVQAILYTSLLLTATGMMIFMRSEESFLSANVLMPRMFRQRNACFHAFALRVMVPMCIVVSFLIPMAVVPVTAHPLTGWALTLSGSLALLMTTAYAFHLHPFPVVMPWLLVIGSLSVMASPYYRNGLMRAFAIMMYTALGTPILWWSLKEASANRMSSSRKSRIEKELPMSQSSILSKIC